MIYIKTTNQLSSRLMSAIFKKKKNLKKIGGLGGGGGGGPVVTRSICNRSRHSIENLNFGYNRTQHIIVNTRYVHVCSSKF